MINDNVIQVVEVLERTAQGVTKPFLCRGDNGALYYAKGRFAGRKSLVSEWIASSLASEFGVPVAEFAVGEVDRALVDFGAPEVADLGSGYVFLSKRVESVMELTWPNVADVPAQTQHDIIVFDYWVRNQDRILTPLGGNPNLLWNAASREVVAIDHNQAFDSDFDANTFFDFHAFAKSWDGVFGDLVERQRYEDRLQLALSQFDNICDRMPDSWWYLDEDLRLDFDQAAARTILTECLPNFWSRR
ncbi:HipA family kinase [Burkholderia ambifaria]|uniref:HipA family kinase n=1 Tax=Burkholderia ambifaria TaxID=152480 RepID=UPI00158A7FD9|nr:HipA family kinase [Burkholderia ambifaria]